MALSDYQQIEYIQGVSGAYIDTGIKPTRYYSIGGIYMVGITESAPYFFGVYDGTRHFSFYFSKSNSDFRWRFAQNTAQSLSPNYVLPYVEQKVKLGFTCSRSASKTTAYISLLDDTSYSSAQRNTPTQAQTATKNLFLMARNNNGSAGGYAVGSRLYSLSIHNEVSSSQSDLIAEYIPIREKTGSSPKVGLYDTVSDAPLWSGTNFVAGPDIVATTNTVRVNVNGTWVEGVPYVNVNGTWCEGKTYVNVNGTWMEGK